MYEVVIHALCLAGIYNEEGNESLARDALSVKTPRASSPQPESARRRDALQWQGRSHGLALTSPLRLVACKRPIFGKASSYPLPFFNRLAKSLGLVATCR